MPKLFRRNNPSAFTIIEIVVAVGVLGLACAATMQVLLRMNQNAALSRLRTGAGTVAQNHIDYLLSIQPFNPQRAPAQIPPELAIGTTDTGSDSNPTVPIYKDPISGEVSVYGWRRTVIKRIDQQVNGVNIELRSAAVTVSYRFRGRPLSVTMSTLRTSDI